MEIIKDYKHDGALRRSFNALATATFGFTLENHYQGGFWGDDYTPYSVLQDGRIVANVSLNRMDMVLAGKPLRMYQIGTVMTDRACRNRGYIRALMAEVEKDMTDGAGAWLFANDTVLSFYPKFGYRPCEEHVFCRSVRQSGPCRMEPVSLTDAAERERLRAAMAENAFFPAFCAARLRSMTLYGLTHTGRAGVYREKTRGLWAVAERSGGDLLLHNVFSPGETELEDVIAAFGAEVETVTLGFTPADPAGYDCRVYKEPNSTFFVRGAAFDGFAEKRMRIPSLSRA